MNLEVVEIVKKIVKIGFLTWVIVEYIHKGYNLTTA